MDVFILSHQPLLARSLAAVLEAKGYQVQRFDGSVPGNGSGIGASVVPAAVLLDGGLVDPVSGYPLEDLQSKFSCSSIVIFGTAVSSGFVVRMLRMGIKGIVLVNEHENALFECLDRVTAGGTYLSPELLRQAVMAGPPADEGRAELTGRERQVLKLIAEGKTTRELATELQISVKTAVAHRTRIMEKLDIHDTATLVRFAIRSGIITA